MAVTTELTETSLTMRQVVPARIERVYAAWTEPERLAEWWCRPPGWAQPELHCDVRPDGQFRAVMRHEEDAEPYEVRGRYLELVPYEKVVFTWRWQREDMDCGETTVTVKLIDLGDDTEVVVTHAGFPTPAARDQHVWGWTHGMENLRAQFD